MTVSREEKTSGANYKFTVNGATDSGVLTWNQKITQSNSARP